MRADKTYHLQRKEDIAKIFSPRSSVRNTQGEHSPAQHGTNAIWIGSIQGDWASAQVLRNFYGRRVGPVSGAFVGAGSFGESIAIPPEYSDLRLIVDRTIEVCSCLVS